MLTRDKAALVIVDVQGKLATIMHNKDRLFDNLSKIIRGAKVLDIPIIWNEQIPDKLGETIPEIQELLPDQKPLEKNSFSCCDNQGFMDQLQDLQRNQVLLVGIETHVCVYQTAIDLLAQGLEVYIVADATSSRHEINYQIGIQAMTDAGAKISSVEMALFEMLKFAEGDDFRQIIKIIK
ncbi:MAG: isochorismatase family protein [candidate division Zixibacteria bacterium]|nr:isochorismatase family protein [candidate division Zixibacteria bacterium]